MRYRSFQNHRSNEFSSWDVGTCPPAPLMGPQGCLTLLQRNIRHLSLVTDGSCWYPENFEDDSPSPMLSTFTSLQTVSWRGLCRKNEFLSLSDCLQANSQHLRALLLHSALCMEPYTQIRRYCRSYLREPSDLIANFLPELEFSTISKVFPSLKSLELTGLPINITEFQTSPTVDISRLHTLIVRSCVHVAQLLRSITYYNESIHLHTLELSQDTIFDFDAKISNYIPGFLKSFTGLRSLYILLNGFYVKTWDEIVEGVMHHCSSLKSLVVHERVSGKSSDADLSMNISQGKQLYSLGLDFLGTSDSIDCLVRPDSNISS